MADAAGRAPLLVEVGTEELPPNALRGLSRAFADGVRAGLEAEQLSPGEATAYATPRRLAVHVEDVAHTQPGRTIERRGPRLDIAFDAAGNPAPAALGFARSCGVDVADLERLETAKGAWLAWRNTRRGGARRRPPARHRRRRARGAAAPAAHALVRPRSRVRPPRALGAAAVRRGRDRHRDPGGADRARHAGTPLPPSGRDTAAPPEQLRRCAP